MVSVSIIKSTPPMTVHDAWMNEWATDIDDTDLKVQMWNEPSFSDRICAALLDDQPTVHCPSQTPDVSQARLAELLGQIGGDFFRSIGIRWLSPVLAPNLLDKKKRANIGDLSRSEMRVALSYQYHVMPERIAQTEQASDYGAEGLKCFLAWADHLPDLTGPRIRLLFKPQQRSSVHEAGNRERLMALFIAKTLEPGNAH